MEPVLCDACEIYNGKKYLKLKLCNNCLQPNACKLILKEDAFDQYSLNPIDLEHLRIAKIYPNRKRDRDNDSDSDSDNNIVTNNIAEFYYLIDEVEEVALRKHKTKENVINKYQTKVKKAEEKRISKIKIKDHRRKELIKGFERYGMCYYDDIPLCDEYIEKGDKSKYTVEQICSMYKEKDFLNNKTNYKKILNKLTRKYKNDIRFNYITEEDVLAKAKKKSIIDYVERNKKNFHFIINTVPDSLQELALKIANTDYKYDSDDSEDEIKHNEENIN